MTDACAKCGYPRKEHSYNGACYGLCGEFVMTSTPSLPAQMIEAVRRAIETRDHQSEQFEGARYDAEALRAVLVTLQQHERDDDRIKQLDDECQRFMREVALLREGHERLEATLREIADMEGRENMTDYKFAERTLDLVNDALAALDTAAPSESLSRSDHIERLEAVVKAARDLLRHAGIKHPGADTVIVSRERVHTLESALAALDTAAPDKPEDSERGLRRDG